MDIDCAFFERQIRSAFIQESKEVVVNYLVENKNITKHVASQSPAFKTFLNFTLKGENLRLLFQQEKKQTVLEILEEKGYI